MSLRLFAQLAMLPAHSGGPVPITSASNEWPTWVQILETLTFRAGYNTNVVITGTTLLGLGAGLIGVFAMLRKRSLMADALSHATLPGIALGFLAAAYLGVDGRSLPVLLAGGAITGVLGVLCIQALLRFTRLHEDAAIGIVLSVFFGAGIVALSYIQKNAASGAAGLDRLIYGQTAAMSAGDAVLTGAIAVAAIITTVLFFKEFALVCFNDAFASVIGRPVTVIDLIMMTLVVVVTVAGLQAVGLILVVAMLIIPAVAARFWTDRLWVVVMLAGLIGASSGYLGSVVSALLPRKPAGSVIVLTSGVIFALSLVFAPGRGIIAVAVRRLVLRLRIAGEHVVEFAYERAERGDASATVSRDELDRLARIRAWSVWFRPLVLWSIRLRGFVVREGPGLSLTQRGFARGAQVSRNHRLWEQYLISYADVAASHVDWSVDQVEHVLSDELIAELEVALARRGIVVPRAATSEVSA